MAVGACAAFPSGTFRTRGLDEPAAGEGAALGLGAWGAIDVDAWFTGGTLSLILFDGAVDSFVAVY